MKSYYAFKYQFKKVFKIENFDGCGVRNKGSENRSGAVGAFGATFIRETSVLVIGQEKEGRIH
jgi:hypothetical protein